MNKRRLSASVDADLIGAAEDAVKRRRADSVSAWVNDALRLKQAHEERLEALAAFIAAYEAEHGEITIAEMRQAERRARAGALAAGDLPPRARRSATRHRRAG